MSEEKENLEVTTESTEKKKFELTPKSKKIINIVVDVVCGAILLFALLLAICSIRSKVKGYNDYTEIFGKAYIAASSESMNGEKPDWAPKSKPSGFKQGDLITVKTLSAAEVRKLEVGDVITFKTNDIVKEKWVLNTHRIKEINYENGEVVTFTTQGDANRAQDSGKVSVNNVIGIYQGKSSGLGKVFLFMNSSTGFFVCIVLPTLIVVAYCVFNLVLVIKKEKKVQTAAAIEEKDAERERIRAELLAEMQGNASAPAVKQDPTPEPEQKSEEQPEAVVVAEEVAENKVEEKVEAPAEEKAEEVKPEPSEEKVDEVKAEPVEKKAKTTTKSASTKTAGTKSAAKPAAAKATGAKTAAKKTNKDNSEE